MIAKWLRALCCLWIVIVLGAVTGCAFTKTETARQIEAGEMVVSGSADWPGYLFVLPRVQGNLIYGLGQGDVSVHLGNSIYLFNAGGGSRLYLSEWINLSVQADAMVLLGPTDIVDGGGRFTPFFLTATPRLTTTAADGRPFYGGVQSNIVVPGEHERDQGWTIESSQFVVVGGLVLGADYLFQGSGFGVQGELLFFPIAYSRDRGISYLETESDALLLPALGQFSVSGYFRPFYEPPEEYLRPSEDWERWQPRDEPQRERPRPPREEERPPPEFDDRGVPIY